jgi:thioester reductase-like protein
MPQQTVLLTGASGFVGRELFWRLARVPHVRIVCLIRARDSGAAASRLQEILEKAQPSPLTAEERSRCSAIQGDITLERLGLSKAQWEELAGSVDRIVHAAASVDWAMPLEAARQINVEGTRRVLELAGAAQAKGVLRKLDYLGTCHVCGRRSGLIMEPELDGSAGFFNNYEQSKFEAEKLVRSSELPFCIFRLPMVVGDSRTGYASTFKVMYWPLKMLSRGAVWAVPAERGGVVDLSPVDYVCDALEALSADPAQRGRTFHLAAGPERASTIGEMLDLAVASFEVRSPWIISPPLFDLAIRPLLHLAMWGRRRQQMKKGKVYRPYLAFHATFDTTQVRSALEPMGIKPPPVREYFQRLIDYAIASDWGKREVRDNR